MCSLFPSLTDLSPNRFQFSLLVLLCSITCVISTSETSLRDPFEVRLYNKVHFEGRYMKVKIGNPHEGCINLPPLWDKKIASVDPLGCVILYAEPDCKGLRRRLERWSWGSSALKDISFENMISSLSPCPVTKKLVISGEEL